VALRPMNSALKDGSYVLAKTGDRMASGESSPIVGSVSAGLAPAIGRCSRLRVAAIAGFARLELPLRHHPARTGPTSW
jgi:hypothetical protein